MKFVKLIKNFHIFAKVLSSVFCSEYGATPWYPSTASAPPSAHLELQRRFVCMFNFNYFCSFDPLKHNINMKESFGSKHKMIITMQEFYYFLFMMTMTLLLPIFIMVVSYIVIVVVIFRSVFNSSYVLYRDKC